MVTTRPPKTIVKPTAVPSIYSSARTELAKLLIYGLFRKIRVLAQDGVRSSVETGQRPWSKGALLHTTPSSTSEAGVR